MAKTKLKFFTSINRLFDRFCEFVNSNKSEMLILSFILIIAAFCRLYRIDQYMTFLGDEGRDVIVVRNLLVRGHPPLIGPGTSIGNMYLGPLYYYLMAIPLFLANFNPVGPAIQIALLGIITVWFVWHVGRIWFGKVAGLIAALLLAISPTVIIYSRSSWNPNIMPFFSLLTMWSIWKVWRDKSFNWLIVLGISFAFVLQSHYLGLLLAPTIFIFWLLTIRDLKMGGDWKKDGKNFIKKSTFGIFMFLILMSPLLIFDIRHNWINTKALYEFLTVRQSTVSIKPWTAIPKIPELLNSIDLSIVAAKNSFASVFATLVIGVGILYVFFRNYKKNRRVVIPAEYWFLFSWIAFGLVGLGVYKQNIYDHYFGFLFVVPPLLMGAFTSMLIKDGKILKALGLSILAYFIYINLIQNPLRSPPNYQLKRANDVAQKIELESDGESFNLGVVAERNYEDGYKYFLLKDSVQVIDIDSQVKSSITNQLFVVCELEASKCDPTHNSTAAVANFGWSKIASQWEVDGVIIYRLVHTNKI